MMPKKISEENLFDGILFSVQRETYQDEKEYIREFIRTKFEAAVVLPITGDGKVILVKQFRAPVRSDLIEVVAGKIEEGEIPVEAAFRELEEETGYEAGNMVSLGKAFVTPGISTERSHYFLARDLKKGIPNPDEDENVHPIEVPMAEFERMLIDGRIEDAKSLVIYGLYKLWRGEQ